MNLIQGRDIRSPPRSISVGTVADNERHKTEGNCWGSKKKKFYEGNDLFTSWVAGLRWQGYQHYIRLFRLRKRLYKQLWANSQRMVQPQKTFSDKSEIEYLNKHI